MSRLLGVVVLCLALASCTSETPGKATKDPKVIVTAVPRIDTPRDVSAFESCKALPLEPTTWWMSKATTPPTAWPHIPGSCAYTFGVGGPRDYVVLVAVLDVGYEGEKTRNPGGHEGVLEGHTTYFRCGKDGTDMVCATWAAIAPKKVLSIGVRQPSSDEGWGLRSVQMYTQYVLERLPKAP